MGVLGAPLKQIFVMKLFAGRSEDYDDLLAIWSDCGFSNPEEAVQLFREAYPREDQDPYLVDFVRQIQTSGSLK